MKKQTKISRSEQIQKIEDQANLRHTEDALCLLRDQLRIEGKTLDLKWVSDKEGWIDLDIVINGETVHTLTNYTKDQEIVAMRDAVFYVVELIK